MSCHNRFLLGKDRRAEPSQWRGVGEISHCLSPLETDRSYERCLWNCVYESSGCLFLQVQGWVDGRDLRKGVGESSRCLFRLGRDTSDGSCPRKCDVWTEPTLRKGDGSPGKLFQWEINRTEQPPLKGDALPGNPSLLERGWTE